MPGSASYSAQMATGSGPDPAVAMNAVGRSHTPFSTVMPPSLSAAATHSLDFSSSKHSSGLACTRWLRATSVSAAPSTSSLAAGFAPIPTGLLLDDDDDIPGADRVARLYPDLGHLARL